MAIALTFAEAAEQVKLNLDIVDVVGRHVGLKRAGRNFTGLCPFHKEKSPSFYVTPAKQMFKCFGCGEGGDSLAFLMKIEGKTYGELIRDLAEDMGLVIEEARGHAPTQDKTELDLLFEMQTESRRYFETQLAHAPNVLDYLTQRNISAQWQGHFGLGYAPQGWENLVKHLSGKMPQLVHQPTLFEKAGLGNIRHEASGYYDRFRNRLMIPIQDERGRIVAFGGRALTPEDQPKYLNSPETPIYHKQRVLYGLFQAKDAIRTSRYAILMEGYFDVISAHMAGIPQAVGVCGTALTENQLKLLKRLGIETLYLCFDMDSAGQKAALRAIELVEQTAISEGLSLKVIDLPGQKDPDEFLRAHGASAFDAARENAHDFLRFKFTQALSEIPNRDTPEGRLKAVQKIVPMLCEIRQPVLRQEYVSIIADILHLAEDTLLLELRREEEKHQENTYPDKKNYGDNAISNRPLRYLGRTQEDGQRPLRRLDSMTECHRILSPKLLPETKEHLLLSYLLLSENTYQLVMNTISCQTLSSPLANRFLEALNALENQWASLEDLIGRLSERFHVAQDDEMMQFLAHRVLDVEIIHTVREVAGTRQNDADVIQDIVKTIQRDQTQKDLGSLVEQVRQLEEADGYAVDNDDEAFEIQLRLKAQIEAKRNATKAATAQTQILLNTEQGA